MAASKRYEILDGLPPYGPMYVSVTTDDEPYFSQGYVIRFFKADGSNWVANFHPGWTGFNGVYDWNDGTVVVVAGGQAYIMSPDNETPKTTFGLTIEGVIQASNGSLIMNTDLDIIVLDNSGEVWHSGRISWDGIKDLSISGDIVKGKSYDPLNSLNDWCDFSINIKTREVKGGSWSNL